MLDVIKLKSSSFSAVISSSSFSSAAASSISLNGRQMSKHCASVWKLLSLPPQPPYTKGTHMSLSTLKAYLGMLARHLPVTAGDMHTRFARSNAASADDDDGDDESLCGGRGGEKLTIKLCAT